MTSVQAVPVGNNNDEDHLVLSPPNIVQNNNERMQQEEAAVSVAVITPCKTLATSSTASSEEADDDDEEESGDTVSETSVASESEQALDILFGKTTLDAPSSMLEVAVAPVEEEQPKTPVLEEAEDDDDDEEEDSKPAALSSPASNKENEESTTSGVTASPPRKTNRVSLTAAAFASRPTVTSPSTSRLATGTGLSELSKQLRVLQAKNQYLQSEMERCQRQLKIMSESKGVSVVDVLASLESACAKEAHAELQSQITSLQAQLEAMEMGGKSGGSPGRASGGRATALKHESLRQQIVALELQVGEAEEMEATLQQETKSLYTKVQTHQTAALTLEATCQLKSTLLEAERAKTAELEAEMAALKEERDALKEKDTKRMAQKWQDTLEQGRSEDDGDPMSLLEKVQVFKPVVDGDVVQSTSQSTHYAISRLPKDKEVEAGADAAGGETADVKSTLKPIHFAPSKLPNRRYALRRTFSDPAILGKDLDAKAKTTPGYVSSMLPRYCSTHKQWQWSYDADDSHRSNLYVKQSAKNMELEVLCRHQQQTLLDLQNGQTRDEAKWNRLELERNAAQTKRNAYEQQVRQLELDLRVEKEQAESLRSQLGSREEEHSLKKDQLQSRLQVHQERIHDVEGQLSSLYVAFELLQEDRSEEQTQQAELRGRLVDADSKVASQMSSERPPRSSQGDEQMALRLSESMDASETGSTSESAAAVRKRAGLLTPSPKRSGSVRKLFSRSPSANSGLPGAPPLSAPSRRSSATPPGLPTPPSSQKARRASTGSAISQGPPPPGTTIFKGYLLQQQPKKKKILRGEVPANWKRKYMVLKRGDDPACVGSFSLWYGDIPQGKVRGTIPYLVRGVSTVTFHGSFGIDTTNTADDSKPHSFTLRINPRDPAAPVIHLAAYSAIELQPWRTILEEAMGVEYFALSEAEQKRADVQMAGAMAKKYVL